MEQFFLSLPVTLPGAILGILLVPVFRSLPASWLADYGETPEPSLHGKRIPAAPYTVLSVSGLTLSAAVLYAVFGVSLYSFCALLAVFALLVTAIADAKYHIIPDQCVIFLGFLALIAAVGDLALGQAVLHRTVWSPIAGLLGGGLIFYAGGVAGGRLAGSREAFGMGDVKLVAVLGLFTGITGILFIMFFTLVTAGMVFGVLMLSKRLKGNEYRPLGPYIAMSAAFYLIFLKQIHWLIGQYFNLIGF